MQCPTCQSKAYRVLETRETTRGRFRRRRHCDSCGFRESTIEIAIQDVPAEVGPPKSAKKEVYDLEKALEEALPDAIAVVKDGLASRVPLDRVRVDLARWVIDDRRKWRERMVDQAEESSTTKEMLALQALLGGDDD